MKFSKTHTDLHGNVVETMSMELNQDVYIDDVLEAFTRFLRAVGYHFDGNIEIVNDTHHEMFEDPDDQFENTDYEVYQEQFNIEKPSTTEWPFPLTPKP